MHQSVSESGRLQCSHLQTTSDCARANVPRGYGSMAEPARGRLILPSLNWRCVSYLKAQTYCVMHTVPSAPFHPFHMHTVPSAAVIHAMYGVSNPGVLEPSAYPVAQATRGECMWAHRGGRGTGFQLSHLMSCYAVSEPSDMRERHRILLACLWGEGASKHGATAPRRQPFTRVFQALEVVVVEERSRMPFTRFSGAMRRLQQKRCRLLPRRGRMGASRGSPHRP
mmetsp:Transcript_58724/g.116621  ORF Transcript_58724/g.116621 Transcript_58724/m.116621 type:complete len:225 (+) Transcript_58724:246-920(+)